MSLCSVFQRYNLKAIHNRLNTRNIYSILVLSISKIQSESNSQRTGLIMFTGDPCAQYFKDTIWKQFTTAFTANLHLPDLCSVFQRYNLKAIHNQDLIALSKKMLVLSISKIQSESNSQLMLKQYLQVHPCAQYFKDTIWKQFTTRLSSGMPGLALCSVFQRYNLKAIHNVSSDIAALKMLVLSISKIQSESNSQH